MAENDPNDEYKFDEFDSFNPEEGNEPPPSETPPKGPKPPDEQTRQKALIIVGGFVFFFLTYQLYGWLFPKKNLPPKSAVTPAVVTQAPVSQPIEIPAQPVVPQEVNSELKQKIANLESADQGLDSRVNTLSDQVSTLSDQVSKIAQQMSLMNQTIENLSKQLAKQSEEIALLTVRLKPQVVVTKKTPRVFVPRIAYYIQAVIPGRAWLIGSNGSTLTVREGIEIPGYGVVTLIDSLQGRVLTTSGRVIRFSQDDS